MNETFAKKFFPGQDPVGKRFNFSGADKPFWEIIGVCGDGKYNSLGEEPKAALFSAATARLQHRTSLVARTKGDPKTVLAAMQREMRNLDPTLPLYGMKTLKDHMKIPLFPAKIRSGSARQFRGACAGPGGSRHLRRDVVRGGRAARARSGCAWRWARRLAMCSSLILRQGMTLALIGSVIGLAIAFGATRLLKSVLYGVSAIDPMTFIGVTFLLAPVAFLACWIPARRASRVDPMIALRAE